MTIEAANDGPAERLSSALDVLPSRIETFFMRIVDGKRKNLDREVLSALRVLQAFGYSEMP